MKKYLGESKRSKARKTVKNDWVFSLKLDELVPHLYEFNLDTCGTVEELRSRFSEFIESDHGADATLYITALRDQYEATKTLTLSEESEVYNAVSYHSVQASDINFSTADMNTAQIDLVRKWELSYDGGPDATEFIDRVEQLANMYEISTNILPKVMPEYLCKKALIWYRNNNKHWREWGKFKSDFLKFFRPVGNFENLKHEIEKRLQLPNEAFKDYVLAIQSLMGYSNLSEEEKLQRIYKNSEDGFQNYIKKQKFSNLTELIKLAGDYESLNKPSLHTKAYPRPTELNIAALPAKKINVSSNQPSLNGEYSDLTATFVMDGILVTAVIDTGSKRNFIRRDFITTLNQHRGKVDEEIHVILKNGSITPVSTSIECQITLGDVSRKCMFIVVPETKNNVTVGLEFLRQFNSTIQIAGLILKCESLEIEIDSINSTSSSPATSGPVLHASSKSSSSSTTVTSQTVAKAVESTALTDPIDTLRLF